MKKIRTKKLFALLLSAAMVISMLCIAPYTASAADEETPKFTSGNYEYTVLVDGTAEITKYSGSATELVIPTELDGKKVSSIGKFSFEKNTSITSLTIPAGIKIGDNAFRFSKLGSLKLSDGVTTIGNGAFSFCESLTELSLPDSVTSIGDFAFQSCKNIKSVKLPNKLEKINDFAFTSCEALTSIEFPSSVKEIGQNSFAHCYGLTSIVIPGTVKLINSGAFSYGENLTSVTLNEGLETVNVYAFSSCLKLMEVTVPDSVTEIGRCSFGYWFDKSVWNDVPLQGFVLKGHTGSAADVYAQGCGVTFENIGITQQPTTEATTAAPTEPTTQATEPTTEPESELSDYIYGDVNGDSKVNVKDATDIQRSAASIITLSDLQKTVADVNKDGNANIMDATDIQKFAASLTVANVGEKVPTALLPKEA